MQRRNDDHDDGGWTCSYTTGSPLGDAEAFVAAHPGQVAFITIDIGGNDVAPCYFTTPINARCVESAIPGTTANLEALLTGLRAAGGSVPIVGMTYYDPFLAYWLQGGAGQTAAHDTSSWLSAWTEHSRKRTGSSAPGLPTV